MNGGSLLRLFQSECFDAHLHMYYLHHMEAAGIQDYLVNEMYKMTDADIDFFLPQLCQIAILRYTRSPLKRFLLDRAERSMYFALRIRWLAHSLADDGLPEMREHAAAMADACEAAFVNHRQGCFEQSPAPTPSAARAATGEASWPAGLRRAGGLTTGGSSLAGSLADLAEACASSPKARRRSSEPPPGQRAGPCPALPAAFPRSQSWEPRGSSGSTSRERPRRTSRLFRMLPCGSGQADPLREPARHHAAGLSHAFCIELSSRGFSAAGRPAAPDPYAALGEPAVPWLVSLANSAARGGGEGGDDGVSRTIERPRCPTARYTKKRLQCEYFIMQTQFIAMLNKLSAELVARQEPDGRRSCFRAVLMLLNRWLLDRRVMMTFDGSEQLCLLGLHLPMQGSRDARRQLLHVHTDQCKIFSSATRAPFLLIYETVNFDEASAATLSACLLKEFASVGLAERPRKRDEVQEGSATLDGDEDDEAEPMETPEQSLWRAVLAVTPRQWRDLRVGALRPKLGGGQAAGQQRPPAAASEQGDGAPAVAAAGPTGASPPPPSAKRRGLAETVRRSVWGEPWQEREAAVRATSPYSHAYASWALNAIVVKAGDDLRQELLASQIISQFQAVFSEAGLPLWLKPVRVVVTGSSSGFVEYIRDSSSIDGIKKHFPGKSLAEIFSVAFADRLFDAKRCFIESCAAYSLVVWFLQVKDRHNGNLMMDSQGHVIHIDFGFMLSNSPGGNMAFEQSPFKLTQEFLDVMDGESSEQFEYFRMLLIRGFLEARKHVERITLPIRMMLKGSKMPCFREGEDQVLLSLNERFFANLTEEACVERVADLIDTSVNNWRTAAYDNYQRVVHGIL